MAENPSGACKSREKGTDFPNRGEKRSVDEWDNSVQNKGDSVHSANAWEQANLGDDSRKQKFLKLMGAGKKQHHGRFVIGDTKTVHTKAVDSEKKVKEIEEQFLEGMEHKLVSSRHAGFGFHTEAGPSVPLCPQASDNGSRPEQEKTSETVEQKQDDSKKETEECDKHEPEKPKDDKAVGFKKLSFVKGNS